MMPVTRVIQLLLLIVTVVYIISGFGITELRVVESITFGLFTKRLAFEIHEYLWIPFIVLLTLHIFMPLVRKWLRSTR